MASLSSIAVIPARGGSKRIPRKNIREFHGKPLIQWTIETLRASQVFDELVVSTDDAEIAEIGEASGASVPFRRPPELSDDHTGTGAVMRHAIAEIEAQQGSRLSQVCLVYPAAVFVTAQDFVQAQQLLSDTGSDYVFSITSFAAPIQRAIRKGPSGETSMIWPEHAQTRSQDLEDAYYDAGQFYLGGRDSWADAKPVLTSTSVGYELAREYVQDIDTEKDWRRAEILFELLKTTPRQ